MKSLFLVPILAVLMTVNTSVAAQEDTEMNEQATQARPAAPADVESIDAIIKALYETVSGPAGGRDWERMNSLFVPDGRLIPTNPNAPGGYTMLSVDGYVERAAPFFAESGFFEWEIARKSERFGNIAHVFTTYESRHAADDPEPFARGINSVQLLYHDGRWWIVDVYWQAENENTPLPAEYLPAD